MWLLLQNPLHFVSGPGPLGLALCSVDHSEDPQRYAADADDVVVEVPVAEA